jgi:hypothetical protein
MARAKMDWRGHGGYYAKNPAGDLMPTDADGEFLPVDADGYLLSPNPTHSQSGPTPPLSSFIPMDEPVVVASAIKPLETEE